LARKHTANREKPLTHNLCFFLLNLYACPASSALVECIFPHSGLECPNIRNRLGADKAQEIAVFQS